ncbi:MAG: SH3 domain-containing protein [Elainellaceae cyanobacterium]
MLAWSAGLSAALAYSGVAPAADALLAQQDRPMPLAQAPVNSESSDYAIELQESTVCSVITGDSVNIRQGPGIESAVVAQLNSGDGVRAEYQQGSWVKLAARVYGFPPDGAEADGMESPFDGWVVFEPFDGWVFNQFVDGCSEAQATRWRSASGQTAPPVLALDFEGLRLVNPATGSTRAVSFGQPESDVISILTNLRGEPSDRGLNRECGAGPLTFVNWADGLSILSSEGEFAGWFVDGRNEGAEQLTTISGIGTGSTRAELDQVLTADVEETTLGLEFFVGGLGGFLTGSEPDAEITALYGGTTCFFR